MQKPEHHQTFMPQEEDENEVRQTNINNHKDERVTKMKELFAKT